MCSQNLQAFQIEGNQSSSRKLFNQDFIESKSGNGIQKARKRQNLSRAQAIPRAKSMLTVSLTPEVCLT